MLTNKVYVRETFPGIQEVFPGKEIIEVPEMVDTEYGTMVCTNCGQREFMFLEDFSSPAKITIEGDGIRLKLLENKHQPIKPGPAVLSGWDLEEDAKIPVLFEFLEEWLQCGYLPTCLNCGFDMTWEMMACNGEDCPGCNICDGDSGKVSTKLFCITRILAADCEPFVDGCGECRGMYSRIKHKIKIEELWEHKQAIEK